MFAVQSPDLKSRVQALNTQEAEKVAHCDCHQMSLDFHRIHSLISGYILPLGKETNICGHGS